ncbi:MAG: hypothetical protein ABIH70_05960 [Chloroflexota bacterium]
MEQKKPRQNYIGAGGWLWGGNYKAERYLYFFHRITALGLILFIIIHLVITTIFRIQGQSVWEATMSLLDKPWFKIGEYVVAFAFVYHALNGLRLILQELGFTLGKPVPPIYPFKDSLRKKRSWAIGFVTGIIILALLFLYSFIIGGA